MWVWEDLGFPGNLRVQSDPLARLKVNLKAHAQLDYTSTIVQSGLAYEVAKWPNDGGRGFTALDIMGSARYWNQDVDVSLNLT